MEYSNGEKSRHGNNAQDAIEEMLLTYTKEHIYTQRNFKIGKHGFASTDQFLAHFVVTFDNNEKWILYSTTSFRSDRIKGIQWDAFNIKEEDPHITAVFLVYPDDITDKERKAFLIEKEKYNKEIVYSVIDDIVSQTELFHMVEDRRINQQNIGAKYDRRGRSFESWISHILSSDSNLEKWKNGNRTAVGMHYPIFEYIISFFHLKKNAIISIDATSDVKVIGRLPSGGNPKTDILVHCFYDDDTVEVFTISCKRSNNRAVSVHQYTANSFATVLDPTNHELHTLLHEFQRSGSEKAMGKDKAQQLTSLLHPYIHTLSLWALGGYGASGDPHTQCAQFIIGFNEKEKLLSMLPIEECCKVVEKTTKMFGTPFQWTYPSKQRGKSIQLKCEIPLLNPIHID